MNYDSQEIDFPLAKKENNSKTPLLNSGNLKNTYLAALSALMYIIVLGMASAFTAPAAMDMQSKGSRFYGISLSEITWIASLPTITSSFGNILSGFLSNKYGRKAAIILISTPYVLSWLMVVYAPTLAWIYTGRILTGFCYGVCSVAVPAYCVEISTSEKRGIIVAGYQLAYVVGVLFMVCLGFGLRWSWMAMIGALLLTISTCLLYFMPESPQWLIRDSKEQEAMKSLQFLRGKNSNFKKEFQILSKNQRQQSQSRISLSSFKSPTVYKPTIISIALFFFQQFSGINILNSYIVDIFKNSGGSVDPQVSAVIFSAVQVVATVFSSLLIDRLGRRPLYITSGALMTVSLMALGIYSIILESGHNMDDLKWIPLAGLLLYIAAFSFGFGPCGIVIPSELVPIHSRSAVLAIAIVSNSIFGFITTKSFDILTTSFGYSGLYGIFGFFSLCGTLFGIFCLPETKGRTVEEINKSFSR